jgi:hypothetical protein
MGVLNPMSSMATVTAVLRARRIAAKAAALSIQATRLPLLGMPRHMLDVEGCYEQARTRRVAGGDGHRPCATGIVRSGSTSISGTVGDSP